MHFLVSKKTHGFRPVLDLRQLNLNSKRLPFKTLQTKQILKSIEPGQRFTSTNLKDAYFHVPIWQEQWQFLRVVFQGQAFQFKVPPFGLPLSPRVFTRIVAAALSPLQVAGIKILLYILYIHIWWSYGEGHRNSSEAHPVPWFQGKCEEGQPQAKTRGSFHRSLPWLHRNYCSPHSSMGNEDFNRPVHFSIGQASGTYYFPETPGVDLQQRRLSIGSYQGKCIKSPPMERQAGQTSFALMP